MPSRDATARPEGVDLRGPTGHRFAEVLAPEALAFIAALHREFDATREGLLAARAERQAAIDAGEVPEFLAGSRPVRDADWTVAPIPRDLERRWVEITGPVERKMVINALNSRADVFMADFEDALSPTWENVVMGQVNLIDAVRGTIEYAVPNGKAYRLDQPHATLLVRPRGWHMVERHVLVDGQPVAAAFFDFGLYLLHNAHRLLERGTGPYFYLPKLESHREARLWNEVFHFAQDAVGIPRGTIKATVLIETVLAAFEMDEILYELRDHAVGLNAGRWDYIFSIIKKFRSRPFVLPDRVQITMTVPFMRAYTELLVRTCHRRGAYALGGMAAFIPNRSDPGVTEVALARVREDKLREATDGFDGTWVAHPDLIPVAEGAFEETLRGRPHQLDRRRDDVQVRGADLVDFRVPGGEITETGLRNNVSVALQYLESWLQGTGAAAIYNLMEDAATAEIARSQVWQWAAQGAGLKGGSTVTRALVEQIVDEELAELRTAPGAAASGGGRLDEAREIFEQVALSETFVDFLTLPAYGRLE